MKMYMLDVRAFLCVLFPKVIPFISLHSPRPFVVFLCTSVVNNYAQRVHFHLVSIMCPYALSAQMLNYDTLISYE